jgi:hypothetical protein
MADGELPENDRERNAYHEAGHIVQAWAIAPASIDGAEIGAFVSRSLIHTGEYNHIARAKVAVAGAIAEARAVSGRPVVGNFVDVARRIAWHIEYRLDRYPAQWLPIPTEGDQTEDAGFSDDDYMRLPVSLQTHPERLEPVLGETAQVVASELLRRNHLTGDEIRELLG